SSPACPWSASPATPSPTTGTQRECPVAFLAALETPPGPRVALCDVLTGLRWGRRCAGEGGRVSDWARRDAPRRPVSDEDPVATAAAVAMSTVAPPVPPVADRRAAELAAPTLRRGPRRARLAIRRVDPWSVFKFTF